MFPSKWKYGLTHLLLGRSFRYGFCEEAILGLAFVSHGIFLYSNDVWQATRINRIAEALLEGHRNEHYLRSRLTVLSVTTKGTVEPVQAIADHCRKGYCSAITVGDVDNAMTCGLTCGIALFLDASVDLMETQRTFGKHFKQMVGPLLCALLLYIILFIQFSSHMYNRPSTGILDCYRAASPSLMHVRV